MSSSERPFGGRFTEWTNGTYKVLSPRGGNAVDTAPLPRRAPAAATSTQPLPDPKTTTARLLLQEATTEPLGPTTATTQPLPRVTGPSLSPMGTTTQRLHLATPEGAGTATAAAAEPTPTPGLPIPPITAVADPSTRLAGAAASAPASQATTQLGVPFLPAAAQAAPATATTQVGVPALAPAPPSSASSLAAATPDDTIPPPSSRSGEGSTRPKKRALVSKPDPVFDRLLEKHSYERPHVLEPKPESDGALAASHSAEPRVPPAGVETAPPEPRVKVSDSLSREMAPLRRPKAAPASLPIPLPEFSQKDERGRSPRDIPTVTRSTPSDKAGESAQGVPRHGRPAAIAGLVLGVLFVAIALGLFVVHSKAPDTSASAAAGNSVPTTAATAPRSSDVPMPAPPPVESLAPAPVEVPQATGATATPSATVRAPRPRAGGTSTPPATKEQASGTNRAEPPSGLPIHTDPDPQN